MGNIFKTVINAIVRRLVGWGMKTGIDRFNGGGNARSQDGQQPLPQDPAARRARHAANKARGAGR